METQGHRHLLALLLLLIVLLFGIASQLPAPIISVAPDGVTAIAYSTFVKQVEAGNVIAVTIQGHQINGVLAKPLSQITTLPTQVSDAPTSKKSDAYLDDTAWARHRGANNPSLTNPDGSVNK